MKTGLSPEEKHLLWKSELDENLRKKHALELQITEQYRKLKKLEILLEKRIYLATVKGRMEDLLIGCGILEVRKDSVQWLGIGEGEPPSEELREV